MNKLRLITLGIVAFAFVFLGCAILLYSVLTNVKFVSTFTADPTNIPTPFPNTSTPTANTLTLTSSPSPSFEPRVTLETLVTATIVFQRDNLNRLNDDNVWMNYPSIYAIDSKVLFIYGSIISSNGGSSLRSLLLKTSDGGITWREVAQPIYGSNVLFVSFIENGEGWMMSGWTIEMIDNLTLYHSTDYGNTWEEISKIPRWQWYGAPWKMQFLSSVYGEIDMIYDAGAPKTNRIAKLKTMDGGKTWVETSAIPLHDDQSNINILNNYRKDRLSPQMSIGNDDSIWYLDDRSWEGSHILTVKFAKDTNWHIVCMIPNHYYYESGNIMLKK